jgi:hypothetical protein
LIFCKITVPFTHKTNFTLFSQKSTGSATSEFFAPHEFSNTAPGSQSMQWFSAPLLLLCTAPTDPTQLSLIHHSGLSLLNQTKTFHFKVSQCLKIRAEQKNQRCPIPLIFEKFRKISEIR